ncbi:carbon storage regulator [Cognatiluteimonas telluris]|uniref:carbon storage regulator n=1 Tax=Cognatiluteimonas telluris TaxID=1104775 RepID=UPI001407378F|nr:carbon storage regulator [Lysobacter telluris]
MLIITRKEGEVIAIGDDILIQVMLADPHGVRLGIAAPRDVVVLREEVLERQREDAP